MHPVHRADRTQQDNVNESCEKDEISCQVMFSLPGGGGRCDGSSDKNLTWLEEEEDRDTRTYVFQAEGGRHKKLKLATLVIVSHVIWRDEKQK